MAARHTFKTFRPLKLLEIGRFSNATAALGVKESRKQLIEWSNNNWRKTFKSSDLVYDQTLSFHSKHSLTEQYFAAPRVRQMELE